MLFPNVNFILRYFPDECHHQFLIFSLEFIALNLIVLTSKMLSTMEPPRLISMDVSTNGRSDCYFRILISRSVKYITIKAGAPDAESLDEIPLDFQNSLSPSSLSRRGLDVGVYHSHSFVRSIRSDTIIGRFAHCANDLASANDRLSRY